MAEIITCEVCLEEFESPEGVTYCCEICGRYGLCEDCSEPENHDCIKKNNVNG